MHQLFPRQEKQWDADCWTDKDACLLFKFKSRQNSYFSPSTLTVFSTYLVYCLTAPVAVVNIYFFLLFIFLSLAVTGLFLSFSLLIFSTTHLRVVLSFLSCLSGMSTTQQQQPKWRPQNKSQGKMKIKAN